MNDLPAQASAPLGSLVAGLLAVILAVVVYIPSLSNGFAWDDVPDIVENPAVQQTGGFASQWVTPYRANVPAVRSPYRPITSISFALNWRVGGGAPRSFHVVNVALHAAATALVFAVLLALGFHVGASGLASVVFAVHPVHTEAVANVVGRADVLMTIFVLLGVLAYLQTSWPRFGRMAAVWAACAAALLTKENGIALPALVVAAEMFRTGTSADDAPWVERLRANGDVYLGLVAVVGGYLVLRYSVIGTLAQLDTAAYVTALSAAGRFTTAVANLTDVARLMLFPSILSADYGPAVIMPAGLASLRFWVGLTTGVGVLVLAFASRKRLPWLGLGVTWAVLSFLVVSNLIIPVGIWLAERTLYLPSVGLSIIVAGTLTALHSRRDRSGVRAAHVLLVVLIGAGAWKSWTRSPVWTDSDSVVLNLVEEHPESARAQWWLARRLVDNGDIEQGLRWYRSAVELNPTQALVVLDFIRALILADEAVEAEGRARAIPAGLHPSRSVYLAQSLIVQGRSQEAMAVVAEGLSLFPSDERLQAQARELGLEG